MDKQSQPFSFDAIKRAAENLGILAKKTVEKAVPYLDPTNPFYDTIPVLREARMLSNDLLPYDPASDPAIPFKERIPMYLQKYGENFMGSHGGLGKPQPRASLPNPTVKRAYELLRKFDSEGNVSINETDEVLEMVKQHLNIPKKAKPRMTVPDMLRELVGGADKDQVDAYYRIPERAKQLRGAQAGIGDSILKVLNKK